MAKTKLVYESDAALKWTTATVADVFTTPDGGASLDHSDCLKAMEDSERDDRPLLPIDDAFAEVERRLQGSAKNPRRAAANRKTSA